MKNVREPMQRIVLAALSRGPLIRNGNAYRMSNGRGFPGFVIRRLEQMGKVRIVDTIAIRVEAAE